MYMCVCMLRPPPGVLHHLSHRNLYSGLLSLFRVFISSRPRLSAPLFLLRLYPFAQT